MQSQLSISYSNYQKSNQDTTDTELFKAYFHSDIDKIYHEAKSSILISDTLFLSILALAESQKMALNVLIGYASNENTSNARIMRRCIFFCHFWPNLDPTTKRGTCNWNTIGGFGGTGAVMGATVGCIATAPAGCVAGAGLGGAIGGGIGIITGIVSTAKGVCR